MFVIRRFYKDSDDQLDSYLRYKRINNIKFSPY